MSLRSIAAKRRKTAGSLALLVVGLGVFAVLWFEPQKLLQEETVNEAAPVPAATSPSPGPSTASSQPATGEIASGTFRSLEHRTTGEAVLLRLADGSHVLRFENLDTSNGPDLRVYLSELPSTLGLHDYGERYLELAPLKGNRGDQNYRIPRGTDVGRFRSAVIWCVRFKVGFGVAQLDA